VAWVDDVDVVTEGDVDAGDFALSPDEPPQPASEISAAVVNAAVRYAFDRMVLLQTFEDGGGCFVRASAEGRVRPRRELR
jgi:hypothetical protein